MRSTYWPALALGLAGVLSLPVLVVLSRVTADSEGVWQHLAATVLPEYVKNSALLLVGVGGGVTAIGVGCAWLVTMYTFPGRRWLTWALLLPLAMPTYLMAYTYTDLLQYSGPVQTTLRDAFGWRRGDYWFPEIRSVSGAVVIFSLALFPYVYLLVRAAFLSQSQTVLEVSRTLGRGPVRTFWTVALPLARPAIAAGTSLALMETLAEYGAVDYFAVDTFTTGIYRTWTSLASPEAAAQLASVLVLVVLVLLVFERLARGRARYDASARDVRPVRPIELTGLRGIAASAICAAPILGGFLVPAGVLARLALGRSHTARVPDLLSVTSNTVLLAAVTSALLVAFGTLIAYGVRVSGGRLVRGAARVVSLGYAVPGSVVAVGVLVTLSQLTALAGVFAGGTLIGLVYAYSVRLSAVSVQALDAGLQKIDPAIDDAARTLGAAPSGVLRRVHLPLLRGSLLTAGLLVFVDVMKELPATMIMRPFDFDTLAVRVHRYASDERLAQAALPALLIVAAGLGPVVVLSRAIDRTGRGSASIRP
ncbi:MAG: iron ABC transporter permease [Planctomycetota bacterium]